MSKSKRRFDTKDVSEELISAMEEAISNMIEEIRKPVDPEATGAGRKAELASIKQTAIDCKELIIERQRLLELVESFGETGTISKDKDYGSGFAERHAKKQ